MNSDYHEMLEQYIKHYQLSEQQRIKLKEIAEQPEWSSKKSGLEIRYKVLSQRQKKWLGWVLDNPKESITVYQSETIRSVLKSGRYTEDEADIINDVKKIYLNENNV